MGTRANIIRRNLDGSYDSIYTHWDGYPEHHAPILLQAYSADRRVAALLALGDLSQFEAKPNPPKGKVHTFDKSIDGVCVAYGRDRGETGTEAHHFADEGELNAMLADAWTEWFYVWDVAKQAWEYTNNPSPTWFKCCGKQQLPLRPLADWQAHRSEVA